MVAGTIPSTILVAWLSYGYQALKANPVALGAIAGMLASAVGMMFAAAWSLVRPELRPRTWLRALALAGGAMALMGQLMLRRFQLAGHHPIALAGGAMALTASLGLAPIYVLGLAAAAGYVWHGDAGE